MSRGVRIAVLFLVLTTAAQSLYAGWPVRGTRRQMVIAHQRQSVTAPVPAVDLGTVPRYPWGYFGAKVDPYHVYHRSYYGDTVDWTFRHGP